MAQARYVVVQFIRDVPEDCELGNCPIRAVGFNDPDEARRYWEYARRIDPDSAPHSMVIVEPDEGWES